MLLSRFNKSRRIIIGTVALFIVLNMNVISFSDISIINTMDEFQNLKQAVNDNMLKAMESPSLTMDREISLVNAISNLGEMRRVNYIKNFDDFKDVIDQIGNLLECDKVLTYLIPQDRQANSGQLSIFNERGYAIYLYARLLLNQFDEDRHALLEKCEAIFNNLASHTAFEKSSEELGKLEIGARSRLWLVIFPLMNGKVDEALNNLDALKNYLSFLSNQNVNSDKIDNITWESRLVECEIYYTLKEYQMCIDAVDLYFDDVIQNLTPESQESDACKAAASAWYRKIKAMRKKYDGLNQTEKLHSGLPKLMIQMAIKLVDLEDRQSIQNTGIDDWKSRVDLLSNLYRDFGSKRQWYGLFAKYYDLDPGRFGDYILYANYYYKKYGN